MWPTQKRFFCRIWKFVHQIHQNSVVRSLLQNLMFFYLLKFKRGGNLWILTIHRFLENISDDSSRWLHFFVFVPLNLPDVTLLWQRRQGLTPASSLYPFGIRCVHQEVLQPLPQLCQFGPDHFLFLHHGLTTRRSAGGFCRIPRWWYNWRLRIWVQRFREYPPKTLL